MNGTCLSRTEPKPEYIYEYHAIFKSISKLHLKGIVIQRHKEAYLIVQSLDIVNNWLRLL